MSGGSSTPRLEAIDVSYTYAGDTLTKALEGLNLSVPDGAFVAVLGPVGCGKTTLLRIFAGFLRPTQGTARCDGSIIDRPSPSRGYVLQENAIFPWMSVRENVEFGLLAKGEDAATRRKVSSELIDLLGLSAFEDAYPKELSAGMSKMVEVARVFATDPSILLLDEPFGALDAQTRAELQDELVRIWQRTQKTILFITHDIAEAILLADRIVTMTAGPEARLKTIAPVTLKRPRDLLDAGAVALYRQLRDDIGAEVTKSLRDQGLASEAASGGAAP